MKPLPPPLRFAFAVALLVLVAGCSVQSSFSVNLPAGTVACSRDSDVSANVAEIVKAVVPSLSGTAPGDFNVRTREEPISTASFVEPSLLEAIEVCRELVSR